MNPLMLSAVAGGTNSAMQLGAQMFNNWQNYNYSKKLMNRQYDLNMRAWNAQNEYNLPVNQMQRLADANLNPHLVYGSGGASATAGTPSGTSQGHFSGSLNLDPLADLASYQGIMNQRANEHYTNVQATQAELTGKKQRELMDAQISHLDSQSSLNTENAFTQGLVNSVAKVFAGDTPAAVAANGKTWFTRGAEAIGDALYWLSGNRGYYQSNTIGSKLNRAKLY